MQTINVYTQGNAEESATKLKNALEQYGAAYFDSYETDFTSEENACKVKCMIGQTAAAEFVYKGGDFQLRINGATYHVGSYNTGGMFVKELYVMDKAIVFLVYNYSSNQHFYDYPVILCKKNNGDSAFVGLVSGLNFTAYSGNYGCDCGVFSINRTTGGILYSQTPVYYKGTSAGVVAGYTPFSTHDGVTLKDVFVVPLSDFRSHTTPFAFTVKGVLYTGISCNAFAVKGT